MKDKERIAPSATGHLYIAIRRSKENRESDLKEICFRHVIRDDEKDLQYIKQRISGVPGVWRIYKTVNARDFEEARKMVITKLVEDPDNWSYRLDSLWKTCLMKPQCKADRNFLVDVDNGSEYAHNVIYKYLTEKGVLFSPPIKTPNGWHFVTEKFDIREIVTLPDVEVKRDGYLFVEKITNGS